MARTVVSTLKKFLEPHDNKNGTGKRRNSTLKKRIELKPANFAEI
jgi:hypothetical protein